MSLYTRRRLRFAGVGVFFGQFDKNKKFAMFFWLLTLTFLRMYDKIYRNGKK